MVSHWQNPETVVIMALCRISSDEHLLIKVLPEFHLYRVSLCGNAISALGKLRKQVTNFTTKTAPNYPELEDIVSRLTLADLNRALYRCEEEERDETNGASGAYNIPDFGPVVYCGLQGMYLFLECKTLFFKM
jgi:hypothetical protein